MRSWTPQQLRLLQLLQQQLMLAPHRNTPSTQSHGWSGQSAGKVGSVGRADPWWEDQLPASGSKGNLKPHHSQAPVLQKLTPGRRLWRLSWRLVSPGR